MIEVRRIERSMFQEVYPLLLDLNNPYLTETDWKRIFDYRWDREEDYCGYGLFDGREIVGFLGLIFSKRWIDNQMESFCNLTSWIVKEKYRDQSLALILPALKLKDHTLTDLSASDKVLRIMKRLGFRELESELKVLLPYPLARGPSDVRLTQEQNEIESVLKGNDLKLFRDHENLTSCSHLLLYGPNGYCYLIYSTVKNVTKYSYNYIHYLSNPIRFREYHGVIRSKIISITKIPFIVVDSRLVRNVHLPFSYTLSLTPPRLYRSAHLEPEQIDNLYSELVLLNFSTISTPVPTGRQLWHQLARRVLPQSSRNRLREAHAEGG